MSLNGEYVPSAGFTVNRNGVEVVLAGWVAQWRYTQWAKANGCFIRIAGEMIDKANASIYVRMQDQ